MATATKKATAKKAPGKDVVKWDEELAKLAEMSVGIEASVGSGGNYIKTRGGQLEYNGGIIPGNKMNVIILDHVIEYVYYTDRFDPDNPQTPAAYAIGRDENDMRWHEDSIEPYAGELCKDSDINQWGSADTGRGKACKNTRRLALLPEDAIEEGIEDAELAFIKVPVTSVKAWAGYVRQLADQLKRPTLGVVTEISLSPDPKTQFKMNFKLIGTIDDGDLIGELLEKRKTAETPLFAGYAKPEEDAAPPQRGRNAPRSKVGQQRTQAPAKAAPRGRR
jgi:hypothetical protein